MDKSRCTWLSQFLLILVLWGMVGPAWATLPTITQLKLAPYQGAMALTLVLPAADLDYQVAESQQQVQLRIPGAVLAPEWVSSMDVAGFAAPIAQMVGSNQPAHDGQPETAQLQLTVQGAFTVHAERQGREVVVSVKPVTVPMQQAESSALQRKVSLNWQGVPVRAVLAMIAEFTQLNIVVSDAVSGTVTVQLHDVPWQEVLSVVLTTKGLAKRQVGNVLYVAPAAEIAAQEKQALEVAQQGAALAPLEAEFIPVKYANAVDLEAILQAKTNAFISSRGQVSVDKRTNTLLVKDTAEQLHKVHQLVQTLDVPVPQVLIEARIVVMDQQAKEELGVTLKNINSGTVANFAGRSLSIQKAEVNTPILHPSGVLGLALGALPGGFALDLELQALESEGQSKIISSPHLTVLNNQEATIEQGQEVPYQVSTSSGATQIEFKKAVLGLRVTPQITPDGKVLMTLHVSDDHLTQDVSTTGSIPVIATSRVTTRVLVNNGQTLVLGGVFKHDTANAVTRVPFLGDLPGLGVLFRSTAKHERRTELMIFITPRILAAS